MQLKKKLNVISKNIEELATRLENFQINIQNK